MLFQGWRINIYVILAFGVFLGNGCSKSHKAIDPASTLIPDKIYDKAAANPNEGAIWPGETSENLFFVDAKARQVGDLVTIIISESAISSQSATTDTSKDADVDMGISSVFGLPTDFTIDNFLNSGAPFNPEIKANLDRSNKGSGTTTRLGSLTANISAVITEVLPNGNFRVVGRRSVTINHEEQIMVLTGIIRPVDVNFDNTIQSRLIANAEITYTGKGVVADEQRVGWGTRILSVIWPF